MPVATSRPLWTATLRALRDLTRLAVTVLVLAVGVGAFAAGPAVAAPGGPGVAFSRAAELPPTASRQSIHEQVADASAARPLPTRRDIVPADESTPSTVPAATTDPVREATGRRGPPRR
ncbi:hypothetical protein [Micromonospora halophytica]|uniref:Uncharacterized protein n=1 Tax=Micromonospora halophytica TaxID=47864 RepID=A0A1C5IW77_9ACTN|nr:hypothetical protein [Micromonospora halophytica]SCG62572.1 hypothetical protein GA0070560_11774 [Micromonospora halophytica]